MKEEYIVFFVVGFISWIITNLINIYFFEVNLFSYIIVFIIFGLIGFFIVKKIKDDKFF
ncbi:MAG: hypothetical protein PHN56_06915 [Candidatus Nanoarchaeia archaeon]|nr:hypothetical protein [Candidatus Nanoarchaeia archaeon]